MKKQDELGIDRFRDRYRLFLFVLLLFAAVMLTAPIASPAQVAVGVSVRIGPPIIPYYVQPLCPYPDFIWIPGFWAWDPGFGYYWVPGMWAPAPFVGMLWTPGYWAWNDGMYFWYEGYWGPMVGYYGGINYGYGYAGYGYAGGYWSGNRFYYNRAVNNVNGTHITTVYNKPVSHVRPTGASFNGGKGGVTARPTSEQLAAAGQRHSSLSDAQREQMQAARANPKQRAQVNHGRPAIAATPKPGVFTGHGVISAGRAGAPYKGPSDRKAATGEHVRNPKHGTETRQQATAPDQRVKEPRRTQRRQDTRRPSPPDENRAEKGRQR